MSIEITERIWRENYSNYKGYIILWFYMKDCSQIKNHIKNMKNISRKLKNIKFLKMNFQENESFCTEYNVVSPNSVLFFNNGEMFHHLYGASKEKIITDIMLMELLFKRKKDVY